LNIARILVATDGSEYSDYALNIAIKIGGKYTSHIDLLNVQHPTSAGVEMPAPVDPILGGAASMSLPVPQSYSDVAAAEAKGKEKAGDLLADRLQLILEAGLECSASTVRGDDVGNEIIKVANSGNYDLTVLGSRGLSGLRSLILGSVSSKVAKEAKHSVLVVRARIELTLPKIMLGYDGSDESKKALEFAADLGKKLNARVDVVSVFNVPVSPEAYLGTEVDRWEKDLKDQVEDAVAKIRASGVTSEGKILDHVSVSGALVEASEKGAYDIIVVGNRGHGRLKSLFLGSVAHGIANSAKTNVLIVR
jgi:nucleotide-binding universal stress UspA family protein